MNRKKTYIFGVVVVLAFLVIAWSRLNSTQRLYEQTGYLMDTAVTIKLYAYPPIDGDALIEQAFAEAQRIETIMQATTGDGDLHRINERGDISAWKISPELTTVLERAVSFYEISGGAFDPTIAAVKWLWQFDQGGRIPPQDEFEDAFASVGFDQVTVQGESLYVSNPNVHLDLGGIAKGYIVDRIIALLKEGGADAGLVNAGGDIFSFGTKPGGVEWSIGLRHPRMERAILLEPMPLPAVATSGDYERCFEQDGIMYHHILDPSTGYPAWGCTSVTVWTNSAMDADVLATTVFVKGPEEGIALAKSLDDVEALIFYEKEGELLHVMTDGVEGKLTL